MGPYKNWTGGFRIYQWPSGNYYCSLTILLSKPMPLRQSGVLCPRGEVIGGRWTSTEALRHIHILELQAAFFALKSLCHTVTNAHIQPQLDNTTAVAYLNKMGGCKSMEFDRLAQEIWGWCIQRKIWVSAPHTAGN